MSQLLDAIVVGQGLAGTAIAWHLRWSGSKILVIDRDPDVSSSKIAAGLITPITGRKLVKTWRHSELWPTAVAFYHRVEEETATRFFSRPSMVRLFADDHEATLYRERRAAGEFDGLVRDPIPLVNEGQFSAVQSGFEIIEGGQLNVRDYLKASQETFQAAGEFLSSDVEVSREIEMFEGGVRLPRFGVATRKLIFCEGIDAVQNPWFSDVQFKPAKGEILTLRIPGLTEDRVIHRGIWLAPQGDDVYKVGSTYDWKQLDSIPTSGSRDAILHRLKQFLKLPFEIISHDAAVRPIHRNQYPIVGVHRTHPQLGYFNGLGSKGSLHAPYFARQLVRYLNEGTSIDSDVAMDRKTRSDRAKDESLSVDSRTDFQSHVKRRGDHSLTRKAQDVIGEILREGDIAIDATAGNGHDTHFLASVVGVTGKVFAFDIQQMAIDATAKRLADANLDNVILLMTSHGQLSDSIPKSHHGQIAAAMFNLGFLPHGDKGITTQAESTLTGIDKALELLRPGGVLTILAYTGHGGGSSEAIAVEQLLNERRNSNFEVSTRESQPGRFSGPRLFIVKRSI